MPHIPYTPLQALDISSYKLRLKLFLWVTAAKITGMWKKPMENAATSFEEMELKDVFYWVYKCANPISQKENSLERNMNFSRDDLRDALPENFVPLSSITMSAAGDILQSEGLEHSKDKLFENVENLLFNHDIAYANFESPITTQPLKKEIISDREPPTECCSEMQFQTLKGHKGKSFTIFNTSNNHSYDMGTEGLETTHKILTQNNISYIGTNQAPSEYGKARILVIDGIKIGFVSATFGLNGRVIPANESHRVHLSKLSSKHQSPDLSLLEEQMTDCRSQSCDLIIASVHWGYEFEFFPRTAQVLAARELAEKGADLILCHHPHVIQPIEHYKTLRDTGRIVPIAYSMGSLTWGYAAPHLALSMIMNVKIVKGLIGAVQRTYISDAQAIPVYKQISLEDGETINRVRQLSEAHIHSPVVTAKYIEELNSLSDLVLGQMRRSPKADRLTKSDHPKSPLDNYHLPAA